jgi:hypothetical protein
MILRRYYSDHWKEDHCFVVRYCYRDHYFLRKTMGQRTNPDHCYFQGRY